MPALIRLGIIGERHSPISSVALERALALSDVRVEWFVEADPALEVWESINGRRFDAGFAAGLARRALTRLRRAPLDCRRLCESARIAYHRPAAQSINRGLPAEMYDDSGADFVLVAGCDQLLDDAGRRLARERMVNFHYSLLPAYRGKYSLFWQWYLREPEPGISFHEVDAGVDSGSTLYQAALEYRVGESYPELFGRAVSACGDHLPGIVSSLRDERRVVMDPPRQPSYFPAREYLRLVTPAPDRTVEEVLGVFHRTGYLRLANGLVVRHLVASGQGQRDGRIEIGTEGITLPLADGWITVSIDRRVPFALARLLVGRARLLATLE
jgi:folate-dependent phosphoribosylglycinamide formyltransferase PurN